MSQGLMFFLFIALHFILVHGPNGQEIELNIKEISSLREPKDTEGHFPKGTQCIVVMTNGKFSTIVESCTEVVKLIKDADK